MKKNFLIKKLQDFYQAKDWHEEADYNLKIFNALYNDNTKLGLDCISDKFGISLSSLREFRIKANRLAEKFANVK